MTPQQQALYNYQPPKPPVNTMGRVDISKTGIDQGTELRKNQARQRGMSEEDIAKALQYEAFMKAIQGRAGGASPASGGISTAQAPADTKPKKKGNFFTDLIPIPFAIGGAALGTMAAPGAGTIAGGAAGGAVGQAFENIIEGNDVFSDPGEYAQEAAFGAIPGVFKSAKILKAAPKGARSLKLLTQKPIAAGIATNATRLAKGGRMAEVIAANANPSLLPKTAGGTAYTDDILKQLGKAQGDKISEASFGKLYKGNILERAGFGLRNSVLHPSSIASPSGAQQSAQLTQNIIKYGIHGSPKSMRVQFGNVAGKLGTTVDDLLAKNNVIVPGGAKSVQQGVTQYASQMMDFTPARGRNIAEVYRTVIAPNIKTGSVVEIRQAHKALNGKLTSAFTKLAKGQPLSDKETAMMAARNSLDDLLQKYAPKAKSALREYSNLFEASKGLAKQADKSFSIPLVGMNSNSIRQGMFRAQDAIGRGLMNTGEALSFKGGNLAQFAKAMSPPISFAEGGARAAGDVAKLAGAYGGANLVARGLTGAGGSPAGGGSVPPTDGADPLTMQLQSKGITEEQLMQAAEEAGVDPLTALAMLGINVDQLATEMGGFAQQQQQGQQNGMQFQNGQQAFNQQAQQQSPYMNITRDQVAEAMMQDLATTGGKNLAALEKFYKFIEAGQQTAEPQKLTAAQQKQLSNLGVVEAQLGQLEQYVNSGMFPDSPQWQASLGGIFNKTIGKEIDPVQRTYIQQLRSRGIQVIRALGEVGNLTATEQEAAIATLPAPGDNLQTAQTKMAILKDLFARVRESTLSFGGYDTGFSDTTLEELEYNNIDPATLGGFAN